MPVVADANMLVSVPLARSPHAPSVMTLNAALDGRLELIASPLLLREIAMVLARPRLQKYLSSKEALRFITDLAAQTTLTADPPGPHPAVCRDSDDDYLGAFATASGADANRHRRSRLLSDTIAARDRLPDVRSMRSAPRDSLSSCRGRTRHGSPLSGRPLARRGAVRFVV
jgi:putative PIN family toxin of toxin-antitoxin system